MSDKRSMKSFVWLTSFIANSTVTERAQKKYKVTCDKFYVISEKESGGTNNVGTK